MTDRDGRLKIHHAALENDAAEVSRCLSDGESVDAADRQGFTPLHFAAQQLSLDAVRVLVAAEADVMLANGWGNTALWTAVFAANGSPQIGGEIVGLLLDRGADPDHKNNAGRTPRDMALIFANDEVLRHLA
jgi:ankyrin repeat protein